MGLTYGSGLYGANVFGGGVGVSLAGAVTGSSYATATTSRTKPVEASTTGTSIATGTASLARTVTLAGAVTGVSAASGVLGRDRTLGAGIATGFSAASGTAGRARSLSASVVPAVLPATGLTLHLSASDLAVADGTVITTWADSSGAGNHATSSGGTTGPVYRAGVAPNGGPALGFAASILRFADNYALFPGATSAEFWAVVRAGTFAANHTGFYLLGGSDNSYYPWPSDGRIYDGSFTASRYAYDAVSPTQWHVYNVYHDGTQRITAIDGIIVHAVTTDFVLPVNAPRSDHRIGNNPSDSWTGEIAAIVAYKRALTTGERAQVLDYLTGAAPTTGGPVGISAALGTPTKTHGETNLDAASGGVSSATATVTRSRSATGGSIGVSAASGASHGQTDLAAASSGISSATATVTRNRFVTGGPVGVSTASGAPTKTRGETNLDAASGGTSSVTATTTRMRSASGDAAGTSATYADSSGLRPYLGAVVGTSFVGSGDTRRVRSCAGSTGGTSAALGGAQRVQQCAGSTVGTSAAFGVIATPTWLTGSTSGNSSATALTRRIRNGLAASAGEASATGSPERTSATGGVVSGVAVVSGLTVRVRQCAGAARGISTTRAVVRSAGTGPVIRPRAAAVLRPRR